MILAKPISNASPQVNFPTNQKQRRQHRGSLGLCLSATIAVGNHGEAFGLAIVIYRKSEVLTSDFILLKPGVCQSAERAWFWAYQCASEWVAEHYPQGRLFIRQEAQPKTSEPQTISRQRRHAA